MPQGGTLRLWCAPGHVRVEHALGDGAEIPPYYDPMVAKLIAHGTTREEARRRLLLGLQHTVALGVPTNQAFLARCLAHPVFVAGRVTTGFVARHHDELLRPDDDVQERALLVAALLLHETANPMRAHHGQRRLAPALPVAMQLDVGGTRHTVVLTQHGTHAYEAEVDGRRHEMTLVQATPPRARVVLDGVMDTVAFVRDGPQLWLHYLGQPLAVHDHTHGPAERAAGTGGDGRIRASTSGRVVAVRVAEGVAMHGVLAEIEAGDEA
jgi:geranyl-CoA carboxylase alpha subunit